MKKAINFTKKAIENLPPAEQGKRYIVKDTQTKGLVVRVSYTGRKTFMVYKKFQGRPLKITIAVFDSNTAMEEVRRLAGVEITSIRHGINPNEEKQKARKEYTIKTLFEEYMERYSKKHKKSWKYDEREIPKFLGHWFNRKISSIATQEIRKFHEKIREENGLYQANRMLERLRAMYNKAIEWGWEGLNPTNGIKKYKEVKRDRFLQPSEIQAFFKSIEQEENEVAKNYFKILLFTGARKSNVLAMRWEEIDLDLNTWRIPDTKNGEPLEVPLIKSALEVIKGIDKTSEWVFPSETSENGHFADPKRPWKRILERAEITDLRMHDVRRTLASYQAITGSSLNIIGASLGHKSLDSTQIYARLHTDAVRGSMENAIDEIMKYKDK